MMKNFHKTIIEILPIVFFLSVFSVFAGQTVPNGAEAGEVRVLVTVMPHNSQSRTIADKLRPTDFAVLEDKLPQKIISVEKASEQPIVLAVLIQDNLVGRVNNELDEIKSFIRSLPENSRVMIAYITTGTLQIRRNFTTDREEAAKSLRILVSSDIATPFSPYLQVVDGLKLFANQPKDARRMLLLISDGLDDMYGLRLSSPFFSLYLDQSITEAQRQSVSVFSIYAPSVLLRRIYRRAIIYGQGSLLRLSDETGGESFFSGSDFVTFNPYFREYQELLKDQWLVTYRSSSTKKGFRRIEVTTDFDIHLNHLAGYSVK